MENCELLIRGGVLVSDAQQPPLLNAAVAVREGRIMAIGPYELLRRQYRAAREIGDADSLLMPGLINAHDHGRALSALQLGIPDDILEVWIFDLLRLPRVDPFYGTACAALDQLQSGITTTVNSYYQAGQYAETLEKTVAAYRQSGIRAGMILSTMDESIIVQLLEKVMPRLPDPLKQFAGSFLAQRQAPDQQRYFEVLQDSCRRLRQGRQWTLAGPVSLHWCSEALLKRIWRAADQLGLTLQTHLLESRYQRAAARRRHGCSAIAYMRDAGLLTANLSCAHCVHIDQEELAQLAEAGVSVVHNASSNLRLCNGIAPLPSMLEHGVNVALGLDSQTLNDDADMFQEMRLVARLHRHEQCNPDSRRIFAMATLNGARALGIASETGSLAVGKRADLLVIDGAQTGWPAASDGVDIFDRIVLHTRPEAIAYVVIDGEEVMHKGRHCRLDQRIIRGKINGELEQAIGKEQRLFNRQVSGIKPYLSELIRELLQKPD